MQVILRRVRQVDRGGDVDGLGPCVIGQEIVVVRKRFSQTQGAGVVEREADRLHIKYEAERGIGGSSCSRYSRWRRGGASSGRRRGAKKIPPPWPPWAVWLPVPPTNAVGGGGIRQPAGRHAPSTQTA